MFSPKEIQETFQAFVDGVNKDQNIVIFLEELLKIDPRLLLHDIHLPKQSEENGHKDNNDLSGNSDGTSPVIEPNIP